MKAADIIAIAKKYRGQNSSADLCLDDAIACLKKNLENHAKSRALRSLEYSVGIFHPDYVKASQ